jgi:hypothetical protein
VLFSVAQCEQSSKDRLSSGCSVARAIVPQNPASSSWGESSERLRHSILSTLASAPASLAPSWLLEIQAIYHEPAVLNYARGREILDRFREAERVIVESHWNIPGLHGSEGNVEGWVAIKRKVLVLGI